MNDPYLWKLLAVTAGVTFLLRAFPFLVFGTGKQPPSVIGYIGKVLSPAAISMLVVYCFACYFRDRTPLEHWCNLPEFISAAVVVLLQVWKHNSLLSIIAGTAVYMTLVQTVVP